MAFDPQLTLTALLGAETAADDVLTFILTQLGQGADGGFPVTNWQDGGAILTLLNADAQQIADTNQSIANIAAGGFVTLAPGNPNNDADPSVRTNTTWLDLIAYTWFNETRALAVFGQYKVNLTVAAGFGPYTIAPNGMWITVGGLLYNSTNASPVTITSSSPTPITFQAEKAGSAYNSPIDTPGTSVTLVTPLPGVTAASDGTAPVVVSGADMEPDATLRTKCTTKWATLSVVATVDAVTHDVLGLTDASGNRVTGILVDDTNPGGAGTCYVYVCTSTGTAGAPLVAVVQTELNSIKPLTSTLTAFSATADTVTLTGDVYVASANLAAVQTAFNNALSAYQAALQIGDGTAASTNPGAVPLSDLYGMLHDAGVKIADLTSPVADTVPAKGHVAVLANSLTWHGI